MARRDDVLGVTGAETIIGAGVVVDGTLIGEGDMVIDGTVTGTIRASGNVTLGVNAEVKASIEGDNITVAGAVDGPIMAHGEATIRETGRVHGNIAGIATAATGGECRKESSRWDRAVFQDLDAQPGPWHFGGLMSVVISA